MNDELYHHGVKGMRWGRRKQRPTSNSEPSKRQLKKERLESYKKDKGPKRGKFLNAANSAARSHFRTERTRSFNTYRKQNSKKNLKEARLTSNQIQGGRYRVARARSIKRNAASIALTAAATTAAVATGAAVVAPAIAAIGGVGLHFATGAHYYGKQRKAYGGTRAKYQATQKNVSNSKRKD